MKGRVGSFSEVLNISGGGSEDANGRSEQGSDFDLLVSLVMSGACLSSKKVGLEL